MLDKILYIDDEPVNTEVFDATFNDVYNVFTANSTNQADEILKNNDIAVVITDQRMPEESGIEFIERNESKYPDIVFMILSGYPDFEVTIKAIKSGRVYRFLQKPWEENQLTIDINNAIERYSFLKWNKHLLINLENQNKELKQLKEALEDENTYLKTEIESIQNFENIVTCDPKLLNTLNDIESIGNSDASVLITGETGTGKELIARAIHNLSTRSASPFIAVNCAAIPDTLFESELFGHERGAFTGALSAKKGKFELANNGTLFLDEIGEIPTNLQAKLLRVIQEGYLERVGGTKQVKLNIRIISATNKNLENEINNNTFRNDLYYRLNVYPIALPPLRERTVDIPLLVDFFINKYNTKYDSNIKKVSQKIIASLRAYNWPGNVRELENIIERAVLTSKNGRLNIPKNIFEADNNDNNNILRMQDAERKHILKVLKITDWRIGGKNGAAELLDLPRTTLISKMEKLSIQKNDVEE